MALDDFEPEGEDTLDEFLDDEDLFDFPSVEMIVEDLDEEIVDSESTDLLDDDSFPPEVVAAAAELQDELDSGRPANDDDLLDSLPESDSAGDDDLAFDELLQENLLDEDLLDAEVETDFPEGVKPEVMADLEDEEEEEDTLDFAQIIPEAEAAEPQIANASTDGIEDEFDEIAPPTSAAGASDEDLVDEDFRAAAPLPRAIAAPALQSGTQPVASKRTFVLMVSGVVTVNLLLVVLGFYAITEFSNGLEGLSRNMSDLVHEARAQGAQQPRDTVPSVPTEPEAQTPRVPTGEPQLPAFSRTELMTARAELDSGQFRSARQRLFRLLAAIDDPLADDAPEAEESANMLIAESYLLEARSMEGDQR